MVTPIIDPVVEPSVTPALYPVLLISVLSVADQVPVLVASPLRQVGGSPVLDQSLSCLVSPPGSVSEPIPSRISPSLRTDDVSGPPSGMAPMDQYLPRDASLLLGESTDFPFLPAPLTPRHIIEKLVPGSVEGSPTGEPVAGTSLSMSDLPREGPFDVHQDSSRSGASPQVLDSLRGCQYRMTSIQHTAFICTIRGCSSMWVRLNRLDSSAVVRNTGSTTWGARRHCRLRCSSNMTRA